MQAASLVAAVSLEQRAPEIAQKSLQLLMLMLSPKFRFLLGGEQLEFTSELWSAARRLAQRAHCYLPCSAWQHSERAGETEAQIEKTETELGSIVPDLNDAYVAEVVGGSIATLTVDASTRDIQSTIVWSESPNEVHIHLAWSSHNRVSRHGGGRRTLEPVRSAEAAWGKRVFNLPEPGTWEKLVPPRLPAPLHHQCRPHAHYATTLHFVVRTSCQDVHHVSRHYAWQWPRLGHSTRLHPSHLRWDPQGYLLAKDASP